MIESLSDVALHHIRSLILSGKLVAGTHLQEAIIARQLGMSRTPVREALGLLAQEGLLVPGPKRGFKVRGITGLEIQDAFEIRAALEGAACRLVAEAGMADHDQAILHECVEIGDHVAGQPNISVQHLERWMDMNDRFHGTIIQATNNQMLIDMVERAQNLPLASARHIHWYQHNRDYFGFLTRAAQDHREIVYALSKHQSYRAEALMREHIWAAARLLEERVKKQEVGNAEFLSEPDVLAGVLPIAK